MSLVALQSLEMAPEIWLVFEKEDERRFAIYQNHLTLGSAPSNSVVISDRGIGSLHGQFFERDHRIFFRDFQTRQVHEVQETKRALKIGEWNIGLVRNLGFTIDDYQFLLEKFKACLKEKHSQSEAQVIDSLEQKFFFSHSLPEILRSYLLKHFQEISLYGPIEDLLRDSEITDILVEDFDQIWIEKKGRLECSEVRFLSRESYLVYIENLLTSLHKSFDEVNPFVDFIFLDGARGHLIGPPLTDQRYYLSIRKPRNQILELSDLFELKMFNSKIFDRLKELLDARKNLLISGSTGSGKTTLLKALIAACPQVERLLILEDTPELKFSRRNSSFLYTRTDSRSLLPDVTLRHLVKQALRMRPDRIIIGEVRGEEALDLLHAMNTGHRGCMGSLHANSARDALFRLQGLVQMADASLSENITRELLARNLGGVIHCARRADGSRYVSQIGIVHGMSGQQFSMEEVEGE